VRQENDGVWAFSLTNGERFEGTARLDDDWLSMNVSVSHAGNDRDSLWRAVRINGYLQRDCRFACWDAACALRSDIPAASPETLDERVAWTCDGLRKAHDMLSDGGWKAEESERTKPDPDHRAALEQHCRDARWEPIVSGDDAFPVRVKLDARHRLHKAGLALYPSGAVHIEVTIGSIRTGELTTASRTALALLLLRASAVVRMIRGFARTQGELTYLGFGVTCAPTAALTAELAHALSALSVVCSLCSREETEVLTNEAMAALFLRTQGMAPCETGSRQTEPGESGERR